MCSSVQRSLETASVPAYIMELSNLRSQGGGPQRRDISVISSPTIQQQEAIALLSNQRFEDVLAYTRVIRSLAAGSPSRSNGGPEAELSKEQVNAITSLSDRADDELRTWWERTHSTGMSSKRSQLRGS